MTEESNPQTITVDLLIRTPGGEPVAIGTVDLTVHSYPDEGGNADLALADDALEQFAAAASAVLMHKVIGRPAEGQADPA